MSEVTNGTPADLKPEELEKRVREGLTKDRESGKARSANEQFADVLLDDALDYRAKQRELNAQIGANRDMLRNLRTTGKLNETQAQAVELLYPVRTKKTAETPAETPKTPNGNEGVAVKTSAKPAPAKP